MTVAGALPLALLVGVIVGGGWLLGVAADRWHTATLLSLAGVIGLALASMLLRCITGLLDCLCRR